MAGYDRIPRSVSDKFGVYPRGNEKFYSEKQKYKQLLSSHDRKLQRYKTSERHDRNRQYGNNLNDDIVQTGSEEDDTKNYRPLRKNRKRRTRKRKEDLMASIERREHIFKEYMQNNQHYLSPKDTKLPNEISYRSSIQQAPIGYPVYYQSPIAMSEPDGPYRHRRGPPPYLVEPVQLSMHPVEPDPNIPIQLAGPQYYSHFPVPKNRESDGQSVSTEQGPEEARNRRTSILNRVEKLLNDMSRQMNEKDLRKSEGAKQEKKVRYVKKKEDTDSGDDSYVFVKTTVTPEPSPLIEPHSDADVSLPSLPASSLAPNRVSRMSFPSGVKSEIQGVYSDEEGYGNIEQRPFTDSYRGHPYTLGGVGRYEQPKLKNSTPASVKTVPAMPRGNQKENEWRAKLVTFYKNGDRNYKGFTLAVNKKEHQKLDKLKEHLTEKMGTPWPIKFIFSIPDKVLVDSVGKFEANRSYIVCKDKNAQVNGVQYGYSQEKHWVTKRPSAGKIRKKDLGMLKLDPPANSPSKNRRIITIIQNKNRIRKEKVILNPDTSMSFDQILSDMGDMINMNATALYLYKKPEVRVMTYSQLFREFKTVDDFIICGDELVPSAQEETGQKRTAPSSNSSNESVTGNSRQKKIQKSSVYDIRDEMDDSSHGLEQETYNMTPEGIRSEDSFEYIPYQHPRQPEENIAAKVKVRIRGKQREYFEPSKPEPEDRCKPNEKLILEWLYGYRHHGGNSSLMLYPKTGELVCYMDAAVVFYNKTFDKQRFYLAHTEEVTCMALHPEGRWIATGQKAGDEPENAAHIRIWDGRTLSTQIVLGVGMFGPGLGTINFSVFGDGFLLCAVDSSDKHVLTVWDWNRKRLVAKTTTTTKKVSQACFYHLDDTILITYGQQHLYFWKLFWDPVRETEGRLLRDKESGIYMSDEPMEITSIAFPPGGGVVTGDNTGSIQVWGVDPATFEFKLSVTHKGAHHRSVNSMCMVYDNILVSGGGKEIKAWDTSLKRFKPIDERLLADSFGDVAAIVVKEKSSLLLYVGTTKACILEGSFEGPLKKHIEAHFDKVGGIVAHPDGNTFFSVSLDMTVKQWSTDRHRHIWKKCLNRPGTCIDIDPKGRYLAVGTADGYVIIIGLSVNEMETIKIGSTSVYIECLKFSAERDMLAVGCRDGCIYIYNDVNENFNMSIRNNTIFKANSSPVLNIDWSTNTHFIQTMSADHELFHWDVYDMVAGRAISFRNAEWKTQTVTVGYSVCGIWTNLNDCDEIKVTSRSNHNKCIAAGDSTGRIRLHKYPCAINRPEYKVTRMYSNDVTALAFLLVGEEKPRTELLISCGGQKSVLARWKVVGSSLSNEH